MSTMTRLFASDGVTIGAYRADPVGQPRGGIVVIQEIFGVNPHIRRVADGYAAAGYVAIAPALFDRVKAGVELGYSPEEIADATTLVGKVDQAAAVRDVTAAVEAVSNAGPVGVVGYCWGGTLSFVAACEIPGLSAAVGYYGGTVAKMLDKRPKVPLMLHFGERDDHIPMSDVAAIRAALPDVPIHLYPTGHGFNCEARGSYDKPSAEQALGRTLDFFRLHLG